METGIGKAGWPSQPGIGRWVCLASIVFLMLSGKAFGQQTSAPPLPTIIPDGTPVKLQLARTISSAHARRGDRLDFEVVQDVTVGGLTVIRAGTVATGSVVKVVGKRSLGEGGEVTLQLDSVELVTGEKVRLHAREEFKGGSHRKLMAAEMFTAASIYLPAAPVFLLTHGRDCTVLKSTKVTAYIDGNLPVPTADLTAANQGDSRLNDMIAYLPPRALDGQGREGDMVNLIFIAKEGDFQRVFARAGWVNVDKVNLATFWHLLWQRKHYVKLPMNTLYLFGKPQDYSYAMPDPQAIVTRRHHLRIWKTDYEIDGSPVWVGAATYDVSIEIEMRKLRLVHRIDPDVDAERDFIARSLTDTRLVTQVQYLSSVIPVFQAQTASGETYHSDSRMLLLDFRVGEPATVAGFQSATSAGRAPSFPFRIRRTHPKI